MPQSMRKQEGRSTNSGNGAPLARRPSSEGTVSTPPPPSSSSSSRRPQNNATTSSITNTNSNTANKNRSDRRGGTASGTTKTTTTTATTARRPRRKNPPIRQQPQFFTTTTKRSTVGPLIRTGPLFWGLVGFCGLFLLLNILLHSRLDDHIIFSRHHRGPFEMKSIRTNKKHRMASDQEIIHDKLTKPEEKIRPIRQAPDAAAVADKVPLQPAVVGTVAVNDPKKKSNSNTSNNAAAADTTAVANENNDVVEIVDSPLYQEDDHFAADAHPHLYTFRGSLDRKQEDDNLISNNTTTKKHTSTEVIDMRQLTATLPFENPDGGAWKQGWNVEPRQVSSDDPLTVFIVPHSHNDPGWIKTFDQYFQTQTIHIITSVVESLEKDPQRRFIWAEISYFSWWWEVQNDGMRQRALALLKRGQLEFVTGGWVMPDEANSQIYALEIQMQEGHNWIRQHLGEEFIPKYGWSIDPFGYSPTMPYVLRNFDFEGILIQRVHYAVKKELAKRKHLEFYWRQTWDEQGTYDMLTHLMPFYSYDVPHTCGPDPSVCCQFDFARYPFGKKGKCPWKINPVRTTPENVAQRARLILDQYLKKASLYRGNAVLIPLGDDFRYQTIQEAEDQFTNYEAVIKYVNENIPNVNIQFGTLREYFEKIKGTFEPPILKGSFFTYSDVNEDYWSGYFTSRAFDKALDRQLERVLYAAEALGATPAELQGARRELSLFQHHDGVTGTAKNPVVEDYAKRLYNSITDTQSWIADKMKEQHPEMKDRDYKMEPCWQAGIPRGYTQSLCADDGEGFVFNPLEHSQICGSERILGKSIAKVKLPCERPGPLSGSHNSIKFDPQTGLLVSPVQEQWMVWKVSKGGAYLFFPEKLDPYDMNDVKISKGGWVVETKTWKRTLIERVSPNNATVLDFIFEVNVQIDNQEWFVRFNTDVKNGGIFHTDLNGFNFDTHYFRKDLPIQSQVFPMPTHASIEDKQTRLTVLSEHAQGTASLQDGAIDVFLDRRLLKDDGRGLAQGVRDNVITRTRLRVVMERQDFTVATDGSGEFQITPFCQKEWNKLNHPLEVYGRHVRAYVPPPQPAPPPKQTAVQKRPIPSHDQQVKLAHAAKLARGDGTKERPLPAARRPLSQTERQIQQLRGQGHRGNGDGGGGGPNSILQGGGVLANQMGNFVPPGGMEMKNQANISLVDATMPYQGHKEKLQVAHSE